MSNIGPGFIAVIGGIITLAMVAVIVAKNAQTSTVLQGAGTALSSVINAAVQPVSTGGSVIGSNSQNAAGTTN